LVLKEAFDLNLIYSNIIAYFSMIVNSRCVFISLKSLSAPPVSRIPLVNNRIYPNSLQSAYEPKYIHTRTKWASPGVILK